MACYFKLPGFYNTIYINKLINTNIFISNSSKTYFVADIAAWASFGTNTVNIATLPCANTIVEYTFVRDARKSRELLITLGTVKLKLASDG